MKTSFRNIFRQELVANIEIPIVQRDYAQGRLDPGVTRIRTAFLRVLREAVADGKQVGLDFIYGEIENGKLIPLDGQQRLTTLFLLHWYLSARAEVAPEQCAFLSKFTYCTRFSARHFCEQLVAQHPPFPPHDPARGRWLSTWLTDQYWYAGAWKYDPTIQSMLVTLDDIHQLFAADSSHNCRAAWNSLVSENEPPITFDFLSVENLGLSDDLYIKMNSRGKPLTAFEHFKADFEKTLSEVSVDARKKFIARIDQDWSDLLWPLRESSVSQDGLRTIIDDEFLRLFNFIGDIVVQRHGLSVDPVLFHNDLDQWAQRIYGKVNEQALAAQDYMFSTLDSLYAEVRHRCITKAEEFTDLFGTFFVQRGYREGCVAIFDNVDLFGDCCAKYGRTSGLVRAFPLARTLLLFTFLEYLMLKPRPQQEEVARRLRTVRNLIFASNNEIRPSNFAALLTETETYMRNGDLAVFKTYNARQIRQEQRKEQYILEHADHTGLQESLHRLEDHRLLRGCLAAFDLDVMPALFVQRAERFHEVFSENTILPTEEICAALLACGDYWQRTRNGRFQFGSPKPTQWETWQELLTGTNITNTRATLLAMLDRFGEAKGSSVKERLQGVANDYLVTKESAKRFDWRYYLVKYPEMRSGDSGLYVSSEGKLGFNLCMLYRTQMNSNYRDPYLFAVIRESGSVERQDIAPTWHFGWDGHRADQRWIKSIDSEENLMSCRHDGFQLRAPGNTAESEEFLSLCARYGIGSDFVLRVPQITDGDGVWDEQDRIKAGAAVLKDFLTVLRTNDAGAILVSPDILPQSKRNPLHLPKKA